MQPNIIAGKYRGKKITVPDSDGLRPTPSRVRETLFNWLQMDIMDMCTLDLFAGSGLLSFEALSRGAKQSTLLEKNKKVFELLKKNAAFLKNENIIFHFTDAVQFVKTHSLHAYQLIFIDPPFHSNLHTEILGSLATKLLPNTLIYIESPIQINDLPFPAIQLKQKKIGQVFFSLFRTI